MLMYITGIRPGKAKVRDIFIFYKFQKMSNFLIKERKGGNFHSHTDGQLVVCLAGMLCLWITSKMPCSTLLKLCILLAFVLLQKPIDYAVYHYQSLTVTVTD